MADVNPIRRLRAVTGTHVPDLEDLLLKVGRGDEEAFSEFYDRTSGLVYGIVVRVVRDPDLAEETTQEIYVELWRLAPRFRSDRGTAKAWTSTIAHRRAVDRVRSEQSRRTREDKEAAKPQVDVADVSDTVVSDLDRASVTVHLDSLSVAQREAVTLAYYGGHTYREVAALLDVPEGTVKTRIRDGLIKLRDAMGASA